MSTINLDVMSDPSRRRLQWSVSPFTAIATPAGSRDLAAVVIFSAIGLVGMLFFALLFPDILSTVFAQVP